MARGGVDDQAGGLVDGQDVVVFVEDLEGDVFGLEGGFRGRLEADFDFIAFFRSDSFFDRFSVEQDEPLFDQVLEIGA